MDDDDLVPQDGIWPNGCSDDPYPTKWLNFNTTKIALNIDTKLNWTQCNGVINSNYTLGNASLHLYQNSLLSSGIKIWFFAGDTDGAVPFNGAIKWIPKLGLKITEEYRMWKVANQTAGFVEKYEKGFTYITIKGTGHMAPQWKREELFILFKSFLANTDLPK